MTTTKTELRALGGASLALVIIFALGFWLGLFETFGGSVHRQRTIQLLGLGVVAACGFYWLFRLPESWRYLIPFVFISWLLFQAGDVTGEALYYGPSSLPEFVRLIFLAIRREL